MEEFDLKEIPRTYFVFDFKLPNGYLPLGYTKHTLPINILNKFNEDDININLFHGYYPSIERPNDFIKNETAQFSTYMVERTPKIDYKLTSDIYNNVNKDNLYLVVLESLNVNNLFDYYSNDKFKIEDFLSPRLLELIIKNTNFKLVFMDIREGAFFHCFDFLKKINLFLEKYNILHKDKVLISTNNSFIKHIKNNIEFKTFKNRINLYSNNYCLLTSGRFIGELKTKNNSIEENNYEFSIQTNVHFNDRERYFLMYNRNPERMHRPYFVNKLYKSNLLNKGYISFFTNKDFDDFLESESDYPPLNLTVEDFRDIRKNLNNFYPLTIDDGDSERVAGFHNFLSRKNEYQNSYFTIVAETNAESDICFITEKTVKPIMNLHPFIILGNPKILEVLKSYGFKTFDKWWDESYDDEFDFKKRTEMVFNIVDSLCNKSKYEWNDMIREMENILIYNQTHLHKLYSKKIYQKEFFQNLNLFKSIL
jgi:hypothetical protein